MGWADQYIEKLQKGQTVQFRPVGNSMAGKVNHRDLCTVIPANTGTVNDGDIVLCRVNGAQYLHLVKAKDSEGRVQIGNNKGRINGWTKAVYGKCTSVCA